LGSAGKTDLFFFLFEVFAELFSKSDNALSKKQQNKNTCDSVASVFSFT